MDVLKSAFSRVGFSSSDEGWTAWPPKEAMPRGPVDVTTLGASPRPWAELDKLGLMPAHPPVSSTASPSAPAAPIGPQLTGETRAGLLGVLQSLDQAGVRLAHYRFSTQSGRFAEYKLMSPETALAHLETMPAQYPQALCVVSAKTEPTYTTSLSDLRILDALHGPSGASAAPNAPLAAALRSLSDHGFQMTSGSATRTDPLYVYNAIEKRLGFSATAYIRQTNNTWAATCTEDVVALDFFKGSRTDMGLRDPILAHGMRDLSEGGYALRTKEIEPSQPSIEQMYVSLLAPREEVIVAPPDSGIAFCADAALLSDPQAVRDRTVQVDKLFTDNVFPIVGKDKLKWNRDQAIFFGAVFKEFRDHPVEETCGRLARVTKLMESSRDAVAMLATIHGASKDSSDIDALVDDFCRLKGAKMSDADARDAFKRLHADLRATASSDVSYPILHDSFLSLSERLGFPDLAQDALGIAALPVAQATFEDRANLMVAIAALHDRGQSGATISDYLTVVNQRRPNQSLKEAGDAFVAQYAPLKAALKNSEKAHQAWQIAGVPVADESQEERTATITRLAEEGCQEPVSAYCSLLTLRLPAEGLQRTADRYVHLHEVLRGVGKADQAPSLFRSLQTAFRQDPTLDVDAVVGSLGENIVMSTPIDRALAAALDQKTRTVQPTEVDSGGGYVTINGIRLPRNAARPQP